MTIQDASRNAPDGYLIGNSATEKIGFFGATTVVQQTNVADSTSTTTTTATTTALETDVDNLRTTVNAINSRLETLGLLASS